MATTFAERKVALNEIAARIRSNVKRLADSLSQAVAAEADLTAMQTAYTSMITDINTDAAASPSDVAAAMQKVEKDKLVAEFQALKTRATTIKNAINGVG